MRKNSLLYISTSTLVSIFKQLHNYSKKIITFISFFLESGLFLENSGSTDQSHINSIMKSILYTLLLLTTMFLSSCGISPKRAAKDYCKCLQPLADIMELQDTLKTQGLIDSLAAVTIIYDEVWNDSQECMEKKLNEYGQKGANSAFKSKARKLIKSKCPDVWERAPKH